ncbi:MAG: low molecular weight protein-tyrosine-phosphatase [Gammaproteobacteria bacterium]
MNHLLKRKQKKRILTVCTGNICRSPSAEAVLHQMFEQAGLSQLFEIDSAGTQAVNFAGASPDPDAINAAARRQYSLAGLQARQFELSDFHEFDYILAMDKENYQRISYLKPINSRAELRLFMSFIPALSTTDVPDPYRRRTAAFEKALDLIEMGAGAIVESLKEPQGIGMR